MQQLQYQPMFANEITHWWFVAKRLFVAVFLKKIQLSKKNKILDLGCGTGGMTQFLQQWGKVNGVEQNSKAIDFCKQRKLQVIQSSINKIPVDGANFDLITVFDVLYHKKVDEKAVLKEAGRLLKKNGYLLITDCVLPFFWSIHDEQMMAKKRFRKKELENLLAIHDFKIIRSTYLYFATFPLFVLQRMFLKTFRPKKIKTVGKIKPVLNSLLLFLAKIDLFLIEKNINLPIGSSVIILAKRK